MNLLDERNPDMLSMVASENVVESTYGTDGTDGRGLIIKNWMQVYMH